MQHQEYNPNKRVSFQTVLNELSGQTVDSTDSLYTAVMRAYTRRNKQIDLFFKQQGLQGNAEKIKHLKLFLHGIYVAQIGKLMPHSRELPGLKRTRPLDFTRFIYRLLSGKQERLKTISNEGMSFFLTFFRTGSKVTNLLTSPVPPSQQKELQSLIDNKTDSPQTRFQKLITLIMEN